MGDQAMDDSRLQLVDFNCGLVAANFNERWPFGDGGRMVSSPFLMSETRGQRESRTWKK
jgi:hypothetical protein